MHEILKKRWMEVGERLIGAAEEMPAASYGFQPAPGAWTFAEQLRHVAYWNRYVRETLRGGQGASDANALAAADYPEKGGIVAALRASVEEVASELEQKGEGAVDAGTLDTMAGFIEHNGEHYGQLAVYLRLNGIVPPASR